MRFTDKAALVTGASEGIGLSIAAGLVEGGARVLLVARREDKLVEAARKLGPSAHYLAGDVADPDTAARAVREAVSHFGKLDLLVNNAGVLLPGTLEQQSIDEVDRMFGVNLRAAVAFTQAAAPAMSGRPGAAVLNVSSGAGSRPMPGGSFYGATKAALNFLTRAWAIELAPRGIRVNGIAPGATHTPAFHAATGFIPQLEEGTIATNLIKRLASSDEIARIALTLLDGKDGGYVTGSVWDVDGGYQLDRSHA